MKPALLMRMSMRPKRVRDIDDDALDRGAIEDVERPGLDAATGGTDFAGDRIRAGLVDIGNGDECTFLGEKMGGRAAHSAGGASDYYGAILNRPTEFFNFFHR